MLYSAARTENTQDQAPNQSRHCSNEFIFSSGCSQGSDPSHRIVVRFTPKHASSLNQIEMWFSILARQVRRRGDFASTKDLEKRINDFIDFFNRKLAKPFR
jgi:hypothetical protein